MYFYLDIYSLSPTFNKITEGIKQHNIKLSNTNLVNNRTKMSSFESKHEAFETKFNGSIEGLF